MRKFLLKQIKAKEEARSALKAKGKAATELAEIRNIGDQIESIDAEIQEFRTQLDALPAEKSEARSKGKENDDEERDADEEDEEGEGEGEFRSDKLNGKTEKRGTAAKGGLKPLGTYGMNNDQGEARAKELREASEKRGVELKEMRSVTVASTGVIMPAHQATDIRPTFNEISSLIDNVAYKPLMGGESFQQPYITGYGIGDYKTEGQDYADAEPTFAYAQINKAKVTAYAEDSEELVKLPAANYDIEVQKGIRIAGRKKITREILVGTGATNHLTGIFSTAATAIDVATDINFVEIDEMTLDEIIFSYGGDEDVEDAAVLILNKKDLKAFAQLRTDDGKKIHTIVSKGNFGTIDGIPYIINSACKAISDVTTTTGQYCMAYGPLSNYLLTIFSDLDIQRSTDYKFKQGMIAHRGSIFVGGNVVSKNGFLRVKRA